MIKRILTMLLAVILIFSIVGCKPVENTPPRVNSGFFDQVSFKNNFIAHQYGTPNLTLVSHDFNEVYTAFEKLSAEYKLDEITYAFNYHGDKYTVFYYFTAIAKTKDTDISGLETFSDSIAVASKIYYNISIKINGELCCNEDCVYNHGDEEPRTAQFDLLFANSDDTPIINKNSKLEYKKTDQFGPGYKNPYVYEVTADGEPLFCVNSCVEMTDEIFEFFVDYLVQYDGRPC